jgi:hypothetical protein
VLRPRNGTLRNDCFITRWVLSIKLETAPISWSFTPGTRLPIWASQVGIAGYSDNDLNVDRHTIDLFRRSDILVTTDWLALEAAWVWYLINVAYRIGHRGDGYQAFVTERLSSDIGRLIGLHTDDFNECNHQTDAIEYYAGVDVFSSVMNHRDSKTTADALVKDFRRFWETLVAMREVQAT